MATAIANYAAKKLLGAQMEKYKGKKVAGDDDPYFATVTDRHGKPKKVKKQIPDYIPHHDAEVLARAKKRAYHLDMSLFNLFGIRFGWSSVIGIIPEIGDVIDMYFAYRLVERCKQVDGGLPPNVVSRMWLNVAIDFLVGLVPFVGDLVDAVFRCNTKNVALLEKHLKEKYGPKDKAARDRSGLEAFSDDSDLPPYYDDEGGDQHRGRPTAQDSRQTAYPSHQTTKSQQSKGSGQHRGMAATQDHRQATYPSNQTAKPQQSQNGSGGSYFGWFNRTKQPDLEGRQGTGTTRA